MVLSMEKSGLYDAMGANVHTAIANMGIELVVGSCIQTKGHLLSHRILAQFQANFLP